MPLRILFDKNIMAMMLWTTAKDGQCARTSARAQAAIILRNNNRNFISLKEPLPWTIWSSNYEIPTFLPIIKDWYEEQFVRIVFRMKRRKRNYRDEILPKHVLGLHVTNGQFASSWPIDKVSG